MKISGYGSGKEAPRNTTDRAARFRKRYRVGETVSGKMVRWERPGLAWINFEGHLLTAKVSSSPALGERLLFLVKSLTPEIHLQELHTVGAEALAGNAGRLFARARAQFEGTPHYRALGRILAPLTSWKERRAAFFAVLERDDRAAEDWLQAHTAMNDLSRTLDAAGLGRTAWLPWLIPGADRMEILIGPQPDGNGNDILAGFRLPGLGACRVMISARNNKEFRLALPAETPKSTTALIQDTLSGATGIPCTRISALPPTASPGPLAELLAGLHRSRGYGSTGLNLKA